MSFVSGIEHVFENLFGKDDFVKNAASVLEKDIQLALPIVEEISTVVQAFTSSDQTGILNAISKYLAVAIKDADAVSAWLTQYASLPANELEHAAATFVLSHTHGVTSTVVLHLDTVVQIAYYFFKMKKLFAAQKATA